MILEEAEHSQLKIIISKILSGLGSFFLKNIHYLQFPFIKFCF